MPIYEYRCHSCRRRVTLFVQGFPEHLEPACQHCGSKDLSRLFSTFAVKKTDQDIYEDILTDHNLVRGLESNNPRALAEWNRRMSRGLEEDMAPEYRDMLGMLDAGESLDRVSREIKEAAGEDE